MPELPDLQTVYREQMAANDLLLAARLAWVIKCSSCGILAAGNNAAGMLVGHEFRGLGWTAAPGGKNPICPECSALL